MKNYTQVVYNLTEPQSPHTFHIPVMGVGFTIDTPLKVARYGISSVISLVDDVLIEQMREYHCRQNGEDYTKIEDNDDDARARRVTEYLNLFGRLIEKQVRELKLSKFEPDSEITKYFELLPDCELKDFYHAMQSEADTTEKSKMQDLLRASIVPGEVNVNIMTKLDRPSFRNGIKQAQELSDAMSALRGFALSTLNSSIVFSAGINQHLYGYAAEFDGFFPDRTGQPRKRIILKVSDYRSALIQGKYLAKRGLWISEFRVESSLNCGGHAFATKGHLIGPILQEFKNNRESLFATLHDLYLKGCESKGIAPIANLTHINITMQGGIATHEEKQFLLSFSDIERTGWATPFLLAPDVVNVNESLLDQLVAATSDDVYLSGSSPMGTPFWNLKKSPSEIIRQSRIQAGKPGSPCPKRFIALNSEFTEVPICEASRAFQKLKLEELEKADLTPEQLARKKELVLEKSCICHDLGGSVRINTGIDPNSTPAICCGPSISFFKKITSLEEMTGHIYGRLSLLAENRVPHLFIRELNIYLDYLKKELADLAIGLADRTEQYWHEFKDNLLDGIGYYRRLSYEFKTEQRERFLADLEKLAEELKRILPSVSVVHA